jgi:hypothetical protein
MHLLSILKNEIKDKNNSNKIIFYTSKEYTIFKRNFHNKLIN